MKVSSVTKWKPARFGLSVEKELSIGLALRSAAPASLIGSLEVELLVPVDPVPQLGDLEPACGHNDLLAHAPEKPVRFQTRRLHMLQEGCGEWAVVPDAVDRDAIRQSGKGDEHAALRAGRQLRPLE